MVNNKKLLNKTFVLTGTLNSMSRDEAKEKIRLLGGAVSSAVSKKAKVKTVKKTTRRKK